MADPWAKIPDINEVEYQVVLAQYGLTMKYVQGFERTLKTLYVLSKVQIEMGKAPLAEGEFERVISDKGMLGPTLTKLKALFVEIGIAPPPNTVEEGLEFLRKTRNWLAHSYLIDNSRVLCTSEAHGDLIRELRYLGEAFESMRKVWSNLLNLAIERLGEGTQKELEEKFGPVMNEVQREHLRERLEGYRLEE